MQTLTQLLNDLNIERPVGEIGYMTYDYNWTAHPYGTLGTAFAREGDDPATWTVGPARGEDSPRGAYGYWQVFDADGELVGELRDTPDGYLFYDPPGEDVLAAWDRDRREREREEQAFRPRR